eukprot:CAMPEP_0117008142 /NCGR_PEP_ID=MMETSP0472-20121206/7764_1 /TAXON_ID=693140 ORGANISM="Tiarina fusus, Strain LIS" /NCGR_SAMPLE_ID=MMETSP0472 /ASSEMBLY_ACC=CAM_ASM_000603 /LENGTH=137 /DNA_ID=CAMNT_0004710099 /DNA_START=20 /DNA_END=433 /DNA_ORIENTATION=+
MPREGRPFAKFVEIGRVAFINYGENLGKLCVILDVIDNNRAWVDGPGIARQQLNFKRVTLTKFVIKITRGAREKNVKKAWEEAKVEENWAKTAWAQRLERQKQRSALNDFERFQIMTSRKKRSALVKKNIKALKAKA